jgi:hypothetical protein
MLTTDRPSSAAAFIRSEVMQQAASWDLQRSREVPGLLAAIVVSWPEVGRASRALELVDREVRRCARAWEVAYDESGDIRDESVFTSPEWFFASLLRFPTPAQRGSLKIAAAGSTPLSLLVRPDDEVYGVLSMWPASTAAYVMSAFGSPFAVTMHEDCRLEGATFAPPDQALSVLLDVTRGNWRGSTAGYAHELDTSGFRPPTFKAIGESHDDEGRVYYGAKLLVLRTYNRGRQELIHARLL